MYIHIGKDIAIREKEIVCIMDIENSSTSKITKEFLRSVGKNIINVSDDMPRTFIITKQKDNIKIYISPISSATLYRRSKEN